jgi:hypothetical protein
MFGSWPYGFGGLEEVCGCDEKPFDGCEFEGCKAISRLEELGHGSPLRSQGQEEER